MIQIKKPRRIPEKLKTKGKIEIQKLKMLFKQDSDSYLNGPKKFSFKNSIYGHKSVKSILRVAQHNKCCFCERRIESGDVEHFRGKGGYQQDEKDGINKPGYYWLAYVWDNLFFSCKKCNSSFKRNYFPLFNPHQRAKTHHDKIKLEQPIFIDPAKEDPEEFIEFNGSEVRAINGNERGIVTIERIGLNRPFVDRERFTHYQRYKQIYDLSQDIELPKAKREKLFKIVEDASQNNAPYSSMIRCAIRQNFRY